MQGHENPLTPGPQRPPAESNFLSIRHGPFGPPTEHENGPYYGWCFGVCGATRTVYFQSSDAVVFPSPMLITKAPKEWPNDVGQNWVEAHRSLSVANWRAAAIMARTSLQAALRDKGAGGQNLKSEIDNLAAKGILPPVMKDWSTDVRELGNDAAHPRPGQAPPSARDAQDIVEFLDYLLQYLYTLPYKVAPYRGRRP